MTHPIDPDDFPTVSKNVILTMYHGTPLSKERILKEGLRPRKCSEYMDEVKQVLNVDNIPQSAVSEIYSWCAPNVHDSVLLDPKYRALKNERDTLASHIPWSARQHRRVKEIDREMDAITDQYRSVAERPLFVTGDKSVATGYANSHADIGFGELSCMLAHNLVHLSKYAKWRRDNPQAKVSFKTCVYKPPNIVQVMIPLSGVDEDCQKQYGMDIAEGNSHEEANFHLDGFGCEIKRPVSPAEITAIEQL